MSNQTIEKMVPMDASNTSHKPSTEQQAKAPVEGEDPTEEASETEVSREEAFSSFLTDDSLNDIHLEGTDGVRVPANRCILSARSRVFRHMLLGQFSEARQDVVPIGYASSVLRAVVEYILTDTATILKKKNGSGAYTRSELRTLVSLTGAAMYFQLVDLCRKAQQCLHTTLQATPPSAFAILEACRQEGLGVPPPVEAMALECIRNLTGPIQSEDVEFLSPALLARILQDDKLRMEEYQMFQLLRYWAGVDHKEEAQSPLDQIEAIMGIPLPSVQRDNNRNSLLGIGTKDSLLDVSELDHNLLTSNSSSSSTSKSDDDISDVKGADPQSPPNELQDRRTIALELVRLIHLEYIDPHILSTSVATSGLVTQLQLLEAYKQQALTATMQHNVNFQRPRHMLATWYNCKSTVFESLNNEFTEDILQYPPIKSGIHRWTVEVEESGQYTWLGLILSNNNQHGQELPDIQKRSWMYGNDGNAFHDGVQRAVGHKYEAGSTITFTLNILPYAEGNGTLEASLNGGEAFRLFSNLRADMTKPQEEKVDLLTDISERGLLTSLSERGGRRKKHPQLVANPMGFVPAVSMHTPGRVRLVHIHSLKN